MEHHRHAVARELKIHLHAITLADRRFRRGEAVLRRAAGERAMQSAMGDGRVEEAGEALGARIDRAAHRMSKMPSISTETFMGRELEPTAARACTPASVRPLP